MARQSRHDHLKIATNAAGGATCALSPNSSFSKFDLDHESVRIRSKGNPVMGLMELILTVCALAQPASCEETNLSFVDQGQSLAECAMAAPPTIAEWASHHPTRFVARWRCGYPGQEEKDL
jgi:hypothetical protein